MKENDDNTLSDKDAIKAKQPKKQQLPQVSSDSYEVILCLPCYVVWDYNCNVEGKIYTV